MGTTQSLEVEDTVPQGGMPSPTNDTNVDTATDSTPNASDGTCRTNQSVSTDIIDNNKLDDHTDENMTLDQTVAEELLKSCSRSLNSRKKRAKLTKN